MALDIKQGDYLVVGSRGYPIRDCNVWDWPYRRTGIKRIVRVTAETRRRKPMTVQQKWTGMDQILTDVRCTPLDPISESIAQSIRMRLGLDTPHVLLQTYVDGGDTFYRLVLEDMPT